MSYSSISQILRSASQRKANLVRTLAADSRRSFWAMADQGIVSLGNFGVNILLGAYFDRRNELANFAAFWILMELVLFFNGAQAALVVYPLTVRGATADRKELSRLTSSSLLVTLSMWPVFALAVIATAVVGKISIAAGIWAAVAMVLWQTQETVRRALMAHLNFRSAWVGDAISYLGQFVLVAILAWTEKLTLVTTFQAIAITSGVATLVQAGQIGLQHVSLEQMRDFARQGWRMGRWVLLGNLSNLVPGPLFAWNFNYWVGKELVGVNYALTNLLRLVNPLSFTIATLIMPHAARAREEGGIERARRVMHRFGVLGAAALLPYLGLLILFPAHSIKFVYWHAGAELLQYTLALQIIAIGAALTYGSIITGAFLNAVERSRWTFLAQLLSAAVMLFVAMPLTAMYDVVGAAVGIMIASTIHLAAHLYYIRKLSVAREGARMRMMRAEPAVQ